MEPRTAVGVMARAPVAGRCKTRLLAGMRPDEAAALAAAMTRDTLEAADRAGFDRRVLVAAPLDDEDERAQRALDVLSGIAPPGWDLIPQPPGALGARMEAAIRGLVAGGARAALVGTDAPMAPFDALRGALARLERGVVMGPAPDGGYWAIGMTRVEVEVLRDVPWSTPDVAAITRRRCADGGLPLVEIAPAADVDEPADVERLARELAAAPQRAPHTAAWLRASRWWPAGGLAVGPPG